MGAKEVDPLEGIAGDGIVEDHVGGIDAVGPREVNPLVAIVEHLVLRDADRRRALGDLDAVAEVVLRDVLLETPPRMPRTRMPTSKRSATQFLTTAPAPSRT